MIGTILTCVVAYAIDADTLKAVCNGQPQTIRLAGISALERDGSCNSAPACPTMRAEQATPIAERLTAGRTISFLIVGQSYRRPVGENYELRCALVRSGAVVEWPRYMRQYRLRSCR